jgi:hypothetical protein
VYLLFYILEKGYFFLFIIAKHVLGCYTQPLVRKYSDVTTVNEFLPIQNRYHYQNLEFRAIPFKFTWGGWNATYFQTPHQEKKNTIYLL